MPCCPMAGFQLRVGRCAQAFTGVARRCFSGMGSAVVDQVFFTLGVPLFQPFERLDMAILCNIKVLKRAMFNQGEAVGPR